MKTTIRYRAGDNIHVENNLFITIRERGKIVGRREGHNIFLDTGREWLTKLISYASFTPDVAESDERIKYMGFGIGGTRQIAPDFANTSPLTDYGPLGSFTQTDTDPSLTRVERPVRLADTIWLGRVQSPVAHNTVTSATFQRLFTAEEISYAPYSSVPLSEIALFLSSANPAFKSNNMIAYDTFDTISKTTAFELEVSWTIRIG